MKITTRQNIDDFINCKIMALAGASRDEKSFSGQVAAHLTKLGYKLLLINPAFGKNPEGANQYSNVADLPDNITHLLVITPAAQTESVIKQAIGKGIKNIWIQQSSDTAAALKLAEANDINLVFGHCIFMFTQPEGFHRFHFRVKKLFGGIPR